MTATVIRILPNMQEPVPAVPAQAGDGKPDSLFAALFAGMTASMTAGMAQDAAPAPSAPGSAPELTQANSAVARLLKVGKAALPASGAEGKSSDAPPAETIPGISGGALPAGNAIALPQIPVSLDAMPAAIANPGAGANRTAMTEAAAGGDARAAPDFAIDNFAATGIAATLLKPVGVQANTGTPAQNGAPPVPAQSMAADFQRVARRALHNMADPAADESGGALTAAPTEDKSGSAEHDSGSSPGNGHNSGRPAAMPASSADNQPSAAKPATNAPQPAAQHASSAATPNQAPAQSPAPGNAGTVFSTAVNSANAAAASAAAGTNGAQAAETPLRLAAEAQAQAPWLNATIDDLALRIAAKSAAGASRFDIRLDPPELGRIDVRLDVDQQGRAQAQLTADKPQTLDLLQRDQRTLERSLRDAGLDLSGGLSFSLKGQDRQSGDGETQNFGRSRALRLTTAAAGAAPAIAAIAAWRGFGAATRLDITV